LPPAEKRWPLPPTSASQPDAAALFQQVEERFGPVDCLVNNAGINRDVLLAFMSEEQWDEVINTNLRATYVCSRLAVMGMMRQRLRAASVTSSRPAACAARPASATTPPPREA
jgi:NAD(P)-dependent dehydrogenase (short-subunit alcohol dehydrogenase family)